MRVQSPVGSFPVRITGARLENGAPTLQTAMGAWRSEVKLDRADLPLLGLLVAALGGAFLLGRLTSPRH